MNMMEARWYYCSYFSDEPAGEVVEEDRVPLMPGERAQSYVSRLLAEYPQRDQIQYIQTLSILAQICAGSKALTADGGGKSPDVDFLIKSEQDGLVVLEREKRYKLIGECRVTAYHINIVGNSLLQKKQGCVVESCSRNYSKRRIFGFIGRRADDTETIEIVPDNSISYSDTKASYGIKTDLAVDAFVRIIAMTREPFLLGDLKAQYDKAATALSILDIPQSVRENLLQAWGNEYAE